MTRYEAHADIARSADEVWTYAADILRHTEWMSVADAHLLNGDGTQVGARGRERLLLGPFKWDVEFEVVEAEFGRRLLWRSRDPRFDMEVGLELEPTRADFGPSDVLRRRTDARTMAVPCSARRHGRLRQREAGTGAAQGASRGSPRGCRCHLLTFEALQGLLRR